MTHGHEVLAMMQGNNYNSKEELVEAIHNKFGKDELFHTCSVSDLTAAELVDLLSGKGKFMPSGADGFTVDSSKVCNH